MSLTTPADGQVIRRDGEVGDFIPSNQPFFYLAKSGSPLRISADVDEEDIPLIKAGDKVLIKADAFPDRVFDGQVSEITPKGDPVARSYRVRIALPPDTALKIGMTAETNIITKESPNARTFLPIDWGWEPVALGIAFAMISALVAAFLPAQKGARVHPVDILRGAA